MATSSSLGLIGPDAIRGLRVEDRAVGVWPDRVRILPTVEVREVSVIDLASEGRFRFPQNIARRPTYDIGPKQSSWDLFVDADVQYSALRSSSFKHAWKQLGSSLRFL